MLKLADRRGLLGASPRPRKLGPPDGVCSFYSQTNLLVGSHPLIKKTPRRVLKLADRRGFEPPLELPLNTLSRRAPSTTRPPILDCKYIQFLKKMQVFYNEFYSKAWERPAIISSFSLPFHKNTCSFLRNIRVGIWVMP